jgi:hypothetical protein
MDRPRAGAARSQLRGPALGAPRRTPSPGRRRVSTPHSAQRQTPTPKAAPVDTRARSRSSMPSSPAWGNPSPMSRVPTWSTCSGPGDATTETAPSPVNAPMSVGLDETLAADDFHQSRPTPARGSARRAVLVPTSSERAATRLRGSWRSGSRPPGSRDCGGGVIGTTGSASVAMPTRWDPRRRIRLLWAGARVGSIAGSPAGGEVRDSRGRRARVA